MAERYSSARESASDDRGVGPPKIDHRAQFRRLADDWRAGRGPHSTARRQAQHPSYRKIVGMGDIAIPLILDELEKKPDHWFVALNEITGADPVPEESRGKLREMADAWIRWGREQGYKK